MNKSATSLCLGGCLLETGVPLHPRVAGVQEALGGLTCGPLPSSEASALHKLLGSVQDSVSTHHLASSGPWELIPEVDSLKISILELWFYEAAADVVEPQLPRDPRPCLAALGGCVPHLAKIYLMLNGSPQEHPGLSPGHICFPVSGSTSSCKCHSGWSCVLRSVSGGPSYSSSGQSLVGMCSPYVVPRTWGCLPPVSKCAKCAALVKRTVSSPAHVFPTEHCRVCPVMSNSL